MHCKRPAAMSRDHHAICGECAGVSALPSTEGVSILLMGKGARARLGALGLSHYSCAPEHVWHCLTGVVEACCYCGRETTGLYTSNGQPAGGCKTRPIRWVPGHFEDA